MSSWSSIQKPGDGPQTAVLKDDVCVWSNRYASMGGSFLISHYRQWWCSQRSHESEGVVVLARQLLPLNLKHPQWYRAGHTQTSNGIWSNVRHLCHAHTDGSCDMAMDDLCSSGMKTESQAVYRIQITCPQVTKDQTVWGSRVTMFHCI